MLEGGSDDEGSSTEAHGRAIIEILGRDKRNEVLAALYMVRADVSLSVRQVMTTTFTFFLVNILFIIIIGICLPNVTTGCIFLFSGCITCVENYCGKYSKDS